MLSWIDRIPLLLLAAVAFWMAIAPIKPEPHLIEKLRMLIQGALVKPLDIFDLLIHMVPLILLVIRLIRMVMARDSA